MLLRTALLSLGIAAFGAASAQWTYYALTESGSFLTDVTPDGQYSAGFMGSSYFRWSVAGGVQAVGGSNSGGNAYISADGQYIAGEALDGSANRYGAQYSFASATWTLMGHPVGWGHVGVNYSTMWGMDDSGDLLAAAVYDAGSRYKPVSYQVSTGTFGMNASQGATFHARPNDMSGDGSTIVGWDQVSGRNASAWRGGVQVYFDSGVAGEIAGTNSNGTLHFGFRSNLPVWWDNNFAPTTLALPSGFNRGAVASGTDDGSLMVGYAQIGTSTTSRRPVVWVNSVPQLLSDWAASNGMTFGSTLVGTLTDISPDGRTLLGWRLDGSQKGFVMQNAVPEPTTWLALGAGVAFLLRRRLRR